MIIRAVAVWSLILVFAVINGFVRERFIVPALGDLPGHIVSTLILSAVVAAAILLTAGWVGPDSLGSAFLIGGMWVAMTLAFEFLAGHYLFGNSWEKLFADYNISHGRIWPLVLLTEFLAPAVAFWFGSRG